MINDLIKTLELQKYEKYIKDIFLIESDVDLVYRVITKNDNICCPRCKSENYRKNGYYVHKILHSISNCRKIVLEVHEQRYKCHKCKKVFQSNINEGNKFGSISQTTRLLVLNKLREHTNTYTSVARELNMSTTSVIRIFDKCYTPHRRPLQEIISIDEFYTGKNKYRKFACVIYNFIEKKFRISIQTEDKIV